MYAYVIIGLLVIGAVVFGYNKLSERPVGRFDEMSAKEKAAFEKMYGPSGAAANRNQQESTQRQPQSKQAPQ